MTLLETLQAHAFVQGLNEAQVAGLAAMAREVTFEENEIVLFDGERSDAFYLLVEGSVAVELRAANFVVCVQSLSSGCVFGWSSLLDHQDTLFRVRARERTRALRINGAQLKDNCFQDPVLGTELLHRVLGVVAGRVRATERRFAEMCGIKV